MNDYIGQQFGNYQILRKLGEGTFATVYLAEHRYLEVPTAIKILNLQMGASAHELFRREAYTIAHLQHPHIIRILDFGIQDQTPYLVMEYTPNGTLRSLYPGGKQLSLEQIVFSVKQIASALDYAHTHHVIHRDVKPENLLLNAQHQIVLSDFGIAVVQEGLLSHSTQIEAGTPLYMAPEQIRHRSCAASDQYALGIIVYEWLTGTPPFRGTVFQVWSKHLHQKPPGLRVQVPEIPADVEDVVFNALAKDPEARFATVQDFATALEKACFATQLLPRPIQSESAIAGQERYPIVSAVSMPTPTTREEPFIGATHLLSMMQTPLAAHSTMTRRTRQTTTQTNRQRLLQRVRTFWIEGVLRHSLHGAALITLGLKEQQNVLADPWQLVLRRPDTVPHTLPTGTSITQAYDTCNGDLLILGAPGCGKTTLLLELARDLLNRAEGNEQHPLPVVFNLSTWALKQLPLTDWLIEELTSKYQVPRKLGRVLVETEQLLPLLDGLDEVAPRERTACIEAINSYRQEHGLLPLVVCSRLTDYLNQNSRLQLGSAVVIQPLTEQQIDTYVESGGAPLQALRVALQQDEGLRDLARSPLMLNILMLTYRGMPVEQLLRIPSQEARQRQVFDRYIEQALTRRGTETRYTFQQTTRWLSWLARQLTGRNQSVFYIERMQPDWLEDERERRRYPRLVSGCVFGLIAALFLGPSSAFLFTRLGTGLFLGTTLASILMNGLLFGLLNSVTYDKQETEKGQRRRRWSWKRIGGILLRGMLNGCLLGVLIGLPEGLVQWGGQVSNVLISILATGAVTGFLGGLLFMLIDGFLNIRTTEIRPAETFVWSWMSMLRNLVKFLGIGLLGSLGIVFLLELFFKSYEYVIGGMQNGPTILQSALAEGVQAVQFLAPLVAAISGLLGALTGGMSSDILDARNHTTPNQGIRLSARHSVLVGCIGVMIGAILGGLLGGVYAGAPDLVQVLKYGLFFGSLIGLTAGLRVGGIACIQHMILRWRLWKNRSLPWHCAPFLDYAAERILLCKVGSGYIFVHRLLLEYFAELERGDGK